ncbi:hypothetical protein FA95DRAFT_1404328 [Auriscalpium vulgare]|uniref:Uncharacterized protein n=1 Tax=Auriscalpium vulgare TaxID=40419 RepID=A0ACB8R0Y3_9AGAM|nr:hypothetical protein FA95DRAFT_1404328 [Auriscalpium vulgare]
MRSVFSPGGVQGTLNTRFTRDIIHTIATMSGRSSPTIREHDDLEDAAPPFDSAHADVILRSCDGVRFRVSKAILALTSPVFSDMLTIGITATQDDTYDGLPVVRMSEDSTTLDLLLRFCYPVRRPKLTDLEDVRRMVEATHKFDIGAFDDVIEDALKAHLESDPLGVFAIAVANNLEDMTQTAARSTLGLPLSALVSPESESVVGRPLVTLIRYHTECAAAAAAVTMQREFPRREHFTDTRHHNMCKSCCILDLHGSSLYAPRYLWKYLDTAGRVLLIRPHVDAIASLCEITECHQCAYGFKHAEGTKELRFLRYEGKSFINRTFRAI